MFLSPPHHTTSHHTYHIHISPHVSPHTTSHHTYHISPHIPRLTTHTTSHHTYHISPHIPHLTTHTVHLITYHICCLYCFSNLTIFIYFLESSKPSLSWRCNVECPRKVHSFGVQYRAEIEMGCRSEPLLESNISKVWKHTERKKTISCGKWEFFLHKYLNIRKKSSHRDTIESYPKTPLSIVFTFVFSRLRASIQVRYAPYQMQYSISKLFEPGPLKQ